MKIYKTTLAAGKDYTEKIIEKKNKLLDHNCNSLDGTCKGGTFAAPFACVGWFFCKLVQFLAFLIGFFTYYATLVAYHVTSLAYESAAITKPNYAKGNYKNLIYFDKWTTYALQTINKNINEQHTQVREELQTRHTTVVNYVNAYTNCRVELHGYDVAIMNTPDYNGPLSKELLLAADDDLEREGHTI